MRLRRILTHPILILSVVFALLPFILPRIGSSVSLGTEIVIYTLYGIGYNLLLGYTGLVSFGPSAYLGVAAYASGLAQLHLASNVYVAVVLGTLTAGITGLVLGTLILRRRGLYFSLLTLAFTQLFYEIAFQWTPVTGGENGLQGMTRPGLESNLAFHAFCSVVVIVAVVFAVADCAFAVWTGASGDPRKRPACSLPRIQHASLQIGGLCFVRDFHGLGRKPAHIPDPGCLRGCHELAECGRSCIDDRFGRDASFPRTLMGSVRVSAASRSTQFLHAALVAGFRGCSDWLYSALAGGPVGHLRSPAQGPSLESDAHTTSSRAVAYCVRLRTEMALPTATAWSCPCVNWPSDLENWL